jgi:hypothetical protein
MKNKFEMRNTEASHSKNILKKRKYVNELFRRVKKTGYENLTAEEKYQIFMDKGLCDRVRKFF